MAEFTQTTTVKIDCPDCHSTHIVKMGKQNNVQRYLCRGCGKAFRANGMPTGRQVPAEQIGMAVRMFYSGMSYKQIGESMADAFDIPEPSKSTIYDWVSDYTEKATETMSQPEYRAVTGPEWVTDELQVQVGGKKYWLWNVMDSRTRYILASHLSRHRNMQAAEAVMEKAEAAATEHPKVIKSDRLASYPAAISLVFPETKHVQSDGIRAEVNNNLSERLQGTYRQRIKTMRGLDSLQSGQRYLDGWTLTYNFFREHESINDRTPAEAAKVNGPYKEWADVVEEGAGVAEPKEVKPRIHPTANKPVRVVGIAEPAPKRQLAACEIGGTRRIRAQKPPAPPKRKTARNPAWLKRREVKGRL